MKIHTPIFILGLLVFVTPIIGLPQLYEQIILAAFGVAIMILVSSINIINNIKSKNKINSENDPEDKVEIE
jgi:hypothetical protein